MATAPPGSLVLIDGFPRSLDNLEAFEAQASYSLPSHHPETFMCLFPFSVRYMRDGALL